MLNSRPDFSLARPDFERATTPRPRVRVNACAISRRLQRHHSHPEHGPVADIDIVRAHEDQLAVIAHPKHRQAGGDCLNRITVPYIYRQIVLADQQASARVDMKCTRVYLLRLDVLDRRRLAGGLIDRIDDDAVFTAFEDWLTLKLRRGESRRVDRNAAAWAKPRVLLLNRGTTPRSVLHNIVSVEGEVMPTLDSQVHAYEGNHPGRPWAGLLQGPAEVTGDQMVAAMDAIGVEGAVLVSPFSMYRYDASYALQVYAAHPRRFRLVKPVDSTDPAVADTIADWAATEGTVGIRIMLRDEVSTDPADAGLNRVLAAAAQHSLPVNLLCWGRLEQAAQLAARNPDTRLVIDPSRAATAVRATAAAGAVRRSAEGVGASRPRQHCDQDQRRLHFVARTVSLQGHLGSARPHIRRLWLRSLHVGHRLDARGRIVDLRAGGRAVSRDRPPV